MSDTEQQQPETQALQPTEAGDAMPAEHDGSAPPAQLSTLSVDELISRVQKVRRAREKVMEEDVHYGVIPGTGDKPSLKKPGAELLLGLFNLDPEPNVEINDLGNGHREYVVTGAVYHIPTGRRVGSGFGSCSTKESKYRYRTAERTCPECGQETIIKGKEEYGGGWLCWKKKGGCGASWDDGASEIEEQDLGKIENPDIADTYNTVGKMAKKRWMVDVALTATHASELFTQDVEDLQDLDGADVGGYRNKQSSSNNQSESPQRATWEAPHGQSFAVYPKYKEQLETAEENLEALDGADLGAKLEQLKDVEWGGVAADALDHLIKYHEQRLEDDDSGKPSGNGSGPDTETSPSQNENGSKDSTQDPDEVKEAADNVEVAGEDANDEAFENEDDLPF